MSGTDREVALALSLASDGVNKTDVAMNDASGLLQTLQGHLDSLRSNLQCGICVRLLYEPYTLGCGHTFCYACLTSWFTSGGRSNKTCPDCRAQVKTQPAPAYLVRSIVRTFISHAELLEKGETTAEHEKHRLEESEKLEADKANPNPRTGGLFQGCFKEIAPAARPIIDVEDGVTRCPHCSWELEDDACTNCGYHVDADTVTTDSEENSEMTDYNDFTDDMEDGFGDIDEEDTWNEFYDGVPFEQLPFGVQQFYDPLRRIRYHNLLHADPYEWQFPHSGSSVTHEDSEDEDDDDEDDEMDSFIDDDVVEQEEDGSGTDHSTVVGDHSYMTHDVYETGTDASVSHGSQGHTGDSEEEESSEDEEPIRRPVPTGPQRRFQGPFGRAAASGPRVTSYRNQRNNRDGASDRISRSMPTMSEAGTSADNAVPVEDDSDRPVSATRRRNRNRGRETSGQ